MRECPDNRRSRASSVLLIGVLFLGAPIVPATALAHGGGLNAEGCHNNRKTGDYHCHRAVARSTAAPRRSRSVRSEFQRLSPCPSTGRASGSCPGWEVDHVVPLACGGTNSLGNLQWLTREENRSKGDLGCSRR